MSEIVEETAATAQFEELPDAPPRRRMKFSWSGKLGICVVAFWVVMVFVGEYIAPYHEAEMLDALYEETVAFADRVERGEVQLTHGAVNIVPPDPLPRKDGSIPLPVR